MLSDPLPDLDAAALVDWLELQVLFSPERQIRIDVLDDALEIEADNEEEDIGLDDAQNEERRTKINQEIEDRIRAIGSAYPFSISANGEVFSYNRTNEPGAASYLLSLLASNSWTSGLLRDQGKLNGGEASRLRNAFEVLSALAAAGFCEGPSFLIGTNRAGAQALLDRIFVICEHVGEGSPRAAPLPTAPLSANDDGVDVISVKMEQDGPPHQGFHFVQSASGANWRTKPIRNEIENFLENWFSVRPAHHYPVVVIPAILSKAEIVTQTRRLGHILHRLRAPLYVARGFELAENNHVHVDSWARRNEPGDFVTNYLTRLGLPAW